MTPAATPRDLLFGLLALQTGLIDQGALLSAFHAWTRDKTRPMSEILAEQGNLSSHRRALLEGLVDEHLAAHGGDVETSVASLAVDPSTREKLAELGDPDIDETLARVGPASTEVVDGDGGGDRTTIFRVGSATSDGQRFRVLRPHAKGGIGAVFVALDAELHREVALKQIQDHHADDPVSRARFLLEAEITGGLEHPGIVPVYGLGSDAVGRPFYAMRFIRGDSLREAISHFHADVRLKADPGKRELELRKLLRRFLDVCNAIEYAHRRGVLHRDLKPGNVMVGKYGETLVVDWGLAKSIDRTDPGEEEERTLVPSSASGTAETLPGSAVGTPAYMSPEQAAGDFGRLGPRSDVYSLGATLYCLLTGLAPFQSNDAVAVLRAVQIGEFPSPRTRDPAIDPALEAVCLKAMAREPELRYESPKALAEDVERWTADEPVSAWREPLLRQLTRWARRHGPLVAGTGALLTTVVFALALSTWLIAREKHRVELARNDLAVSNGRISVEKDRAEQARKDAEVGYKLARDTVDRMFRDVSNGRLLGNPQTNGVRVQLADEALLIYRQFVKLRPEDPDLRLALGSAEELAASMHRMVGEFDRAREGYLAATALLKPLCDRYPDRPRYHEIYAYTETQFGEMFRLKGRNAEAEPHYREAVRIAAELSRAYPDQPRYASLESRSLGDLASWASLTGRRGEVEPLLRRAVERARIFDASLPARTGAKGIQPDRLILPMALSGHGVALLELGRANDTRAVLSEVISNYRKQLEDAPRNNDLEYLLADSLNEFGKVVARDPARLKEALAAQDEALNLMTPVAARFPEVVQYPGILAAFHADRGVTHTAAGQFEGARRDLDEARRILVDQVTRAKGSPMPLQQLGKVTGDLGRLAAKERNIEQARTLLNEAIGHQRKALDLDQASLVDKELLERHQADLKALGSP
jgi:serine/threonine protein kinase